MSRWFLLLASLLAVLCVGSCGKTTKGDDDDIVADGDADSDGDSDADCIDGDGDGAGAGDGCTADDCDDTDPNTTSQCGENCDTNPMRAGCPCNAGEVSACYMGPDGTGGKGVCQAGLKTCENGAWGGCEGQVLPVEAVETTCNGQDDNCDGTTDEGVTSECGDCNDDCRVQCIGSDCADGGFDPEQGRSIVVNPDGSITLSGAASITNFVIWVANSQAGTVSKVNTRTRLEEGRYRTMDPALAGGREWSMSPSRTTVNPHGDVVVSNRESMHGGSTKILASDCPDRNGNGVVETSTGTNDVLDWGDDECVAWYVGDIPSARGSAFEVRSELDGGIHEYVWVGSYPFSPGTIYEIDSITGEKTGVEIPATSAYGLAMGPGGLLWSVGLGECPVSTDTTTLEQTRYNCPFGGAYGVAVDSEGRVWIGSGVSRLTPEDATWEQPVGGAVSGGGITVDAFGNAYTGEWGGGWGGGMSTGYKIDGETMEVTQLPGMGGHGWAVDFDGYIWSVDMTDSAHVMDPETLEVEDVRPPFVGPYTYSDMTGFLLQNTITPAGVYERLFETCENQDQELSLAQLRWNAEVPAGSAVSFRIKHGNTVEELDAAPWIDVASMPPDVSPIDLHQRLVDAGVDTRHLGHLVKVEATLQSIDRLNRPVLFSFELLYSCSDIFG